MLLWSIELDSWGGVPTRKADRKWFTCPYTSVLFGVSVLASRLCSSISNPVETAGLAVFWLGQPALEVVDKQRVVLLPLKLKRTD